ncbi:MAG: hypothetical protein V1833_00855 [Elusimicrobiota bacterium]
MNEEVTGSKTFSSSVTVTASAFSVGGSTLVVVDGKVGIGTAAPRRTLDVNGEIVTDVRVTLAQDLGTVTKTWHIDNQSGKFRIFNQPNINTVGTDFFSIDNSSNIVFQNGKVGIGTTNPGTPLEIVGAIHAHDSGTAPDNGYQGMLRVTRPAVSGQYINLVRSGIYPWSIGTVYDSSTFAIGLGQTTDSNFTSPGFVMTTGGNVGIGTTGPTRKLTVVGGSICPAVGSTADSGIEFPLGGTADEAFIRYYTESGENTKLLIGNQDNTDDDISFYQYGGERLTIYGGNVGINATTPASALTVNGGVSVGSGYTGTAAPANGMIVEGNVGIGTTNPVEKLEVAGYIKSTTGGIKFPDGSTQTTAATISAGLSSITDLNLAADSDANGSGAMIFSTGGSERIRISSGNTGIGTSVPDRKLDINGGVIVRSSMVVTGDGLSGTQTVFQVAGSTMVVRYDGNVGIGTTNPTTNLSIESIGDAAITLRADTDDVTESDNPYIKFLQDGDQVGGVIGFSEGSGIGPLGTYTNTLQNALLLGTISNWPLQFGTVGAVRVTIDTAGNVGIGTTAPGTKLDVNGQGANTVMRVLSGNSAYYSDIQVGRTGGEADFAISPGASYFSNFATAGDTILRSNTEDLILSARNTSGAIRFGTGATDSEKMTILSGGNVGIGTANPGAKLEVSQTSGDILKLQTSQSATWVAAVNTLMPNMTAGQNIYLAFGKAESNYNRAAFTYHHVADGSTSNYGAFGLYGVDNVLVFNGAGNVGIGTTSPQTKFDVAGGSICFGNAGRSILDDSAEYRTKFSSNVYIVGYSSAARYYGDGSGLYNLNGGGGVPDNLGSHIATTTLNMSDKPIVGISSAIITGVGLSGIQPLFQVAGSTLVVRYDGYVGISTSNPISKLHIVDGDIRISTTAGQTQGIWFPNGSYMTSANVGSVVDILSGNDNVTIIGDANNDQTGGIIFKIFSSEKIRIINSGNLGVNTQTPDRKLDVNGGVVVRSSMVVTGETLSSTDPVFQVAGSTLVVRYDGSVGIGTASPTSKLHIVDGDIRISTTAGQTQGIFFPDGSFLNSADAGLSVGSVSNNEDVSIIADADNTGSGRVCLRTGTSSDYRLTIINSGNVGIGTVNPTARVDIVGFTGTSPVLRVSTSAAGGNSIIVSTTGNVGIGTTNPQATLHVRDAIRVGGTICSSSFIELNDQNSGNRYAYIDFHGDDTYTDYGLRLIRFNDGANAVSKIEHNGNGVLQLQTNTAGSHIALMPAGNVGIGTTVPGYKLEVSGAAAKVNRLLLGGNMHPAGIQPADSGVSNLHLDAFTGSSGSVYVNWYAGTGGLVIGNGYSVQQVQLGGTGNSWINTGNVGIGTTAPGAKLDILGASSDQLRLTSWSSVYYKMGRNGTDGLLDFEGTQSGFTGYNFKGYGGTSYLYISGSNGNVGIGTTSPGTIVSGTILDVVKDAGVTSGEKFLANFMRGTGTNNPIVVIGYRADGSAATRSIVRTGNNFPLDIGTTGTPQAISILDNGFVGISTTSPISKLHIVDGDIRISTTAGQTQGIYFPNGSYMISAGVGSAETISTNNDALIVGDVDNNGDGGVILRTGSTDKLTIINSGNVGIGTITPDRKLDVNGGVVVRSSMVVIGGGLSGTQTVFQVAGSTMVVRCDGNVGIGTTVPAVKLQVIEGTLNIPAFSVRESATTDNLFIVPNLGAGGYNPMSAAGDMGIFFTGGAIDTGALVIGQWSNSAKGIKIDSAGNVGIGTAAPASKITVSGGASIGSGYTAIAAPANGMIIEGYLGVGTNSPNAKLNVQDGNITVMNGKIGINTSTVGSPLTVNGGVSIGGSYTLLSAPTNGAIIEGNVGIGTSGPVKKLDVIGEIKTSTSTASTVSINIAGAVDTLPASGYSEGTFIYQTSDHTVYVSTTAVDNLGCWKPVW